MLHHWAGNGGTATCAPLTADLSSAWGDVLLEVLFHWCFTHSMQASLCTVSNVLIWGDVAHWRDCCTTGRETQASVTAVIVLVCNHPNTTPHCVCPQNCERSTAAASNTCVRPLKARGLHHWAGSCAMWAYGSGTAQVWCLLCHLPAMMEQMQFELHSSWGRQCVPMVR